MGKTLVLALVLGATLAGCDQLKPKGRSRWKSSATAAVHVTGFVLGTTLNERGAIPKESRTTQFKPENMVYVSVATEGAADAATLMARWSYGDTLVIDTTSVRIVPSGPTLSEFHIAHPDGLPQGRYKVEILLDGKSAGTKDFTVVKQ